MFIPAGTWYVAHGQTFLFCREGPYVSRGTVYFPVATLRPLHSSRVLASGGGAAVVAIAAASIAIIGGIVVAS